MFSPFRKNEGSMATCKRKKAVCFCLAAKNKKQAYAGGKRGKKKLLAARKRNHLNNTKGEKALLKQKGKGKKGHKLGRERKKGTDSFPYLQAKSIKREKNQALQVAHEKGKKGTTSRTVQPGGRREGGGRRF